MGSLSNVKDTKASFATSTQTCGGNAGLSLNLQGSGMKTGNKYKLFVDTATACLLSSTAGTRKEIVEITAPVVGANNGINVYMCVDGYNVDGSNGKTSLDGMAVGIMDTTSTAKTVGCGTAVLA